MPNSMFDYIGPRTRVHQSFGKLSGSSIPEEQQNNSYLRNFALLMPEAATSVYMNAAEIKK